jgi:hypothetical protein
MKKLIKIGCFPSCRDNEKTKIEWLKLKICGFFFHGALWYQQYVDRHYGTSHKACSGGLTVESLLP